MGASVAQTDPNPALNNPDEQSWKLFVTVNANAAGPGDNNALFETWASDGDMFQTTPVWPSGGSQMQIGARALSLAIERPHPHFLPEVLPTGERLIGEETRRNKSAFDFIVQNNLFKVSGLKAAFTAGKPIAFPVDSMEVKANWVEVGRLKEFNGFAGSPAEAAAAYHVNETGGKQYALVSFHIISKLVPNWTWATFEHKDNPGRCDVLGCKDSFGAIDAYVAPLSPVESQAHYPDCAKSPALLALFAQARLDPAFSNYCLKGSQTDFTDPSGLAIRLGNSVTEQTFVAQASCMTCHGRAAFDADGHATTFAGFDPTSVNEPFGIGNAPIGPINSGWFWAPGGPPSFPALANGSDLTRFGFPADFVWSIPFCAIDDTAQPPQTKSRFCSAK
ncbi:MAG TPA: hypothetical protein VF886_02575 [Roseiarcus sp.]